VSVLVGVLSARLSIYTKLTNNSIDSGKVNTMKSHWRKTIVEIAIWLIIEVVLNLAGLDQLGNYSEFIFAQKSTSLSSSVVVTIMV
jgi:hypothetical protein